MKNCKKLAIILAACALALVACGKKEDDNDYNRLDLGTMGGAYQDEPLTKSQKEYLKKVAKWRKEIVWKDGGEEAWSGTWLASSNDAVRYLTFNGDEATVEKDGTKQTYKIEVAEDPLTGDALLDMTDDELSLFLMNYDIGDTQTLFRVVMADGTYYYYTIELQDRNTESIQDFDDWNSEFTRQQFGGSSLTDTDRKLVIYTYSGLASGYETYPMPKEIDVMDVLEESGGTNTYADCAEMQQRGEARLEEYKQALPEKTWGYVEDFYDDPMTFLTFDGDSTCTVRDYDGNEKTLNYNVSMKGEPDNPSYYLTIDGNIFYLGQYTASRTEEFELNSIQLCMLQDGANAEDRISVGYLAVREMDESILGFKTQNYVGTWVEERLYRKVLTLNADGTGTFELDTRNLEDGVHYFYDFTYNFKDEEENASSHDMGMDFGEDDIDFSGLYQMSCSGDGLSLFGGCTTINGQYTRQ